MLPRASFDERSAMSAPTYVWYSHAVAGMTRLNNGACIMFVRGTGSSFPVLRRGLMPFHVDSSVITTVSIAVDVHMGTPRLVECVVMYWDRPRTSVRGAKVF
jgi:hypothetical protein